MLFFGRHYVKVKGRDLNSYSRSYGGGMRGGSRNTTISRYGDSAALYTTEKKDAYFQDPEVREYLTDAKILDEIRRVFTENRMNWWNGKKFTKLFIADGEFCSYSFSFDSGEVYFSSRHYPERYAKKLALLDDAIGLYAKDMKLLPGLVVPRPAEGESGRIVPCRGEVGLYVNSCKKDRFCYKIVNDTPEERTVIDQPVIRNLKDGTVVYASKMPVSVTSHANGVTERYVKLKERLEAGICELNLGAHACEFEIRQDPDQ